MLPSRYGHRSNSRYNVSAEWYRARVTRASANKYTWDVEYDGGEVDLGLCSSCVRPFVLYSLGEWVEVRIDERTFAPALVVATHLDGTFDLELEDGLRLGKVPVIDSRRVDQYDIASMIEIGSRVFALVPGNDDDTWYPGTVIEINIDDTVAIQYDDGDFFPSVPLSLVDLDL
jgi:hypothetical protein